jgi:predicted nucleotidyltransferase
MDRACLSTIARRHAVELLVQFGSTVTGSVHPGSDLDLAILLARVPESSFPDLDLAIAFQPCVSDREIDVVLLNHADPLLLERVTTTGRLLYGDPNRWQEFRAYAFKRYQDHRPFFQMEREYVERAIVASRR